MSGAPLSLASNHSSQGHINAQLPYARFFSSFMLGTVLRSEVSPTAFRTTKEGTRVRVDRSIAGAFCF